MEWFTCGENVCGHSQEGVGHHALRGHGDVELSSHVSIDIRAQILQLIT